MLVTRSREDTPRKRGRRREQALYDHNISRCARWGDVILGGYASRGVMGRAIRSCYGACTSKRTIAKHEQGNLNKETAVVSLAQGSTNHSLPLPRTKKDTVNTNPPRVTRSADDKPSQRGDLTVLDKGNHVP